MNGTGTARAGGLSRTVLPLAFGVAAALIVAIVSFAFVGAAAFGESGAVEVLSPVAYALGAAAIVISLVAFPRGIADRVTAALASLVLVVLAARELDLHKSEWLGSLTRTSTYVDPARPLALRMLAAALLLGALFAGAAFAWRVLREPIRRRRLPAIGPIQFGAVGALAMLAGAKLMDGSGRKLGDIGIEVSEGFVAMATYAEETLELAGALTLFACALALALDSARRHRAA